jgi:hypothetical protein
MKFSVTTNHDFGTPVTIDLDSPPQKWARDRVSASSDHLGLLGVLVVKSRLTVTIFGLFWPSLPRGTFSVTTNHVFEAPIAIDSDSPPQKWARECVSAPSDHSVMWNCVGLTDRWPIPPHHVVSGAQLNMKFSVTTNHDFRTPVMTDLDSPPQKWAGDRVSASSDHLGVQGVQGVKSRLTVTIFGLFEVGLSPSPRIMVLRPRLQSIRTPHPLDRLESVFLPHPITRSCLTGVLSRPSDAWSRGPMVTPPNTPTQHEIFRHH